MLLEGERGSTWLHSREAVRIEDGRFATLPGAEAEFVALKYKPVSFPLRAMDAPLIPPLLENTREQ